MTGKSQPEVDNLILERVLNPISGEFKRTVLEIHRQVATICENQFLTEEYREYVDCTIRHLFAFQGKLLRPALVLLSAKAATANENPLNDSVIKLAAAVELIHSASLIHDDVIDESDRRRNQTSLNKRFGNQNAVLVGDILYARFFSLITSLASVSSRNKIRLLEQFAELTEKMCLGEIYEQRIRQNGINPSFHEYALIIENKTASLMSVCCSSGAMIAEGNETVSQALRDFGLNLGMVFQITDDCLDNDSVFHSKEVLLEKAGDYRENAKKSLEALGDGSIKECFMVISDYVSARLR